MKRNDAEQIGKLIRSFLRQESLESPLNERRLINSWAEVLGPVIASYKRQIPVICVLAVGILIHHLQCICGFNLQFL